ncbi:ABC transporter permease [Nocardioides panacisoli]|uniref:ABC transporter permease n=1 Tax=Nocardioides panacisoli TaxID=627624 RepID=UPI001C6389F8|nr:ABC transporter permease [Nocardioides panacisoli]QYJ05297.1 ABC transporter permease [Nocardioides panacisoli]
MSSVTPPRARDLPGRGFMVGRIVHRQALVFRSAWKGMLFAFLEPIFYLLSIGIGVGALIDEFNYNGQVIPYAEFVAPGMLAAAAMNGAIFDATYNFYSYLKFDKVFEQWLTTPMSTMDLAAGQVAWTLVRGGLYSGIFLVVMLAMGLVSSWWAVLALPAAALLTATFAAIGMAATSFMRSWQDFDFVNLLVLPMLLFSGTFFPVTELPGAVRWVVEFTPLYRGVVLCRELSTGALSVASLVSVVYLVALLGLGLVVVRRRLDRLLLT